MANMTTIYKRFKKLVFFFIIFCLVRSYYLRRKKSIEGPKDRKRITDGKDEKVEKSTKKDLSNDNKEEKSETLSIENKKETEINEEVMDQSSNPISNEKNSVINTTTEINLSASDKPNDTMEINSNIDNENEKSSIEELVEEQKEQSTPIEIADIVTKENAISEEINIIPKESENVNFESIATIPENNTNENNEEISREIVIPEIVENNLSREVIIPEKEEVESVLNEKEIELSSSLNVNEEKIGEENINIEKVNEVEKTEIATEVVDVVVQEKDEEEKPIMSGTEEKIEATFEQKSPITAEVAETLSEEEGIPQENSNNLSTGTTEITMVEEQQTSINVEDPKEKLIKLNTSSVEKEPVQAMDTPTIVEAPVQTMETSLKKDDSIEIIEIPSMVQEPSASPAVESISKEKDVKEEIEIVNEDESTKSIELLINEISKIVNESEPETDSKMISDTEDIDADDEDEGEWIDEDEDEWIDEDDDVELISEEENKNTITGREVVSSPQQQPLTLTKKFSNPIGVTPIKPVELPEGKKQILSDEILDKIFRDVDPQTMWVLRNTSVKTRTIVDNILKETFEQYDLSMDPLYFDVTSKENLGLVLNSLDLSPFALAMLLFEILKLDSQHIGFAFGQMFRVPSKINVESLTDLVVETLCILKTKKDVDISIVMVAFQRYYCFNHSELEFYRLFYMIDMSPKEVANFIQNHYHFIPSKSLTPLLTALEVDEAYVAEMCKHYANDDLDSLARILSKIPVQLVRTSIHPTDVKADHVMMINEEGEDIIVMVNDDEEEKLPDDNDEWLEEDEYSDNEDNMIILENNESFSIFVGRILRFLNMTTKDVASLLKYLPEYCTYEEDEILEGLNWNQEQIDEMRNIMKEEQDKIAKKMRELSKLITQRRMSISAQASPSSTNTLVNPNPFM